MTFVATARLAARTVSRSYLSTPLRVSPLLTNALSSPQQWQRSLFSMQTPFLSTSVNRGSMRTKVSERALGIDAVENSNLGFNKEEEDRKEADVVAESEEEFCQSELAFHPDDSGTTMEDASIEKVLSELNEVFEIIAAVPLMDEEEYGELRKHFEEGRGLDEIDERGYMIKAGTHKIWKGERDLKNVTDGVDTDSALILQRILLHTLNIERKVREMLANGGTDPDDLDEADENNMAS